MEIFIAWNGEASKKLAEVLYNWLPDVIQTVSPFMSSESIRSGQRWFEEIGARLEKTDFAILCTTPTNLKSTWMHFEAGAVSKNVAKSRVCAVLLEVTEADLEPPLSQFQHIKATEEDARKLVLALDEMREEKDRLGPERAKRTFDRCWPELKEGFEQARNALRSELKGRAVPKRTPEEILAGILQTQQGIIQRLDQMEGRLQSSVAWPSSVASGGSGGFSPIDYQTALAHLAGANIPVTVVTNPDTPVNKGVPLNKMLRGLMDDPPKPAQPPKKKE
jgi:hypothetical protein